MQEALAAVVLLLTVGYDPAVVLVSIAAIPGGIFAACFGAWLGSR